jgi:DNA-binding GntR family transcriptional regulator
VETPTVTGALLEQLRDEILISRLSPGEKVNEVRLSEELDISRSPIREVLRILESERLVENIPRKGTFISNVSLEDFIELYRIREMIECAVIDYFEEKTMRKLPLVEKAIEIESKQDLPPPKSQPLDILAHLKLMFEYHLCLVESAGNQRLFAFFRSIHFNVLRYHYLNRLVNVTQDQARDHIKIMESIQSAKYEKAKVIVKSHIKDHADKIIMKLSEREKE